MNIEYCNDRCPIGQAASRVFLDQNNSAYDAALDFRWFVDNCFKQCPFKGQHKMEKEDNSNEANI